MHKYNIYLTKLLIYCLSSATHATNATARAAIPAVWKPYDVFLRIRGPFSQDIHAVTIIRNPTRQGLRELISSLLSSKGIKSDEFLLKSLSIVKESCEYEIDDYVNAVDLMRLFDVMSVKSFTTIHCVFGLPLLKLGTYRHSGVPLGTVL